MRSNLHVVSVPGRRLSVLAFAVLLHGCVGDAPDDMPGTGSLAATGSNVVLMRPTSDTWIDDVVGVGDTTSLFRDVDDATSFGSADDRNYVAMAAGATVAHHAVGYSGARLGKVTSVDVHFRAGNGGAVGSTATLYLLAAGEVVATRGPFSLGSLSSASANHTETFDLSSSGITDANTLRTRLEFSKPANQTGSPRYTLVWMGATIESSTPRLRWAPPAGYATYNPIQLTADGSTDKVLTLANDKDYLIKYPATKRTAPLTINGGRNIVIIGGYGSDDATYAGPGNRNLDIKDRTGATPGPVSGRIIHIEGVKIDGSGGAHVDGIGIDAPSAIVQLENVRVTGITGSFETVHADVIQTYGGVKELRIDRFTGSSSYNNFYFRRENSPLMPAVGVAQIYNTNVFGVENTLSTKFDQTLGAISLGTQPPLDPGDNTSPVNCELPTTVTLSEFYGEPYAKELGQFVHPKDYMTAAGCAAEVSADGTYVDWPVWRTASSKWPGRVTGVVKLGPPPGGDFVPAAKVGLGYVSPGYL